MNKQDKIKVIKEWYTFREDNCEKYKDCKECPLYESTDGWIGENGKYAYVDNCKYSFDDGYVEDIIDLIEERNKINL
jgi:hypothetical protein